MTSGRLAEEYPMPRDTGAIARPARSAPLRVLVLSHLYPEDDTSSSGVFVREQIEALSTRAEVTVIVGRYNDTADRRPPISPSRAEIVEIDLPWPRRLPSSLRVALALPSYYRKALAVARRGPRPPHVVHAFYGFPDGVAGVMLGRALSVPVVVTLLGADFNRQLARPVVGTLIGRTLAKADRVIGVSSSIAEGMRERFRLSDGRAIHMPTGYNERDIFAHTERTPRYFLFVAALIPRKNPDLLLEAFASIASQVSLDLVIVGDGPMMEELRESVRRLGIESRVRFEGEREHSALDGYLAHAAAYVLPSRSEGMPVAVNEALASGTPVVASRLPGTEQQVRSDHLGYLVPAGDVDALAEAMLEAARTDWDYARIARECGVPSWRENAERLIELYQELTDSRGSSSGHPSIRGTG